MKPTPNIENIILVCAYRLLFTENYENITISEIEKGIGRSRGTIFYYFKNKSELFQQVLENLFFPTLKIIINSNSKEYISPFEYAVQSIKKYDSSINASKALINILIQGEKIMPLFNLKVRKILEQEKDKLQKTNSSSKLYNNIGKLFLEALNNTESK